MNQNKKISKRKKRVAVAAVSLLAIGGIVGASAFFTDQAHTDAKAHIGGLNMTVTDLSDLDGDYSNYSYNYTDETFTEGDSVIDTAVAKTEKTNTRLTGNVTGRVVETAINSDAATDKNAPSTNIINPGDSGLLQFTVENVDSKSFRVGMKTSVVVSLAGEAKDLDGTTKATLQKSHKKNCNMDGAVVSTETTYTGTALNIKYPDGTDISEQLTYAIADYDAYTIEGMGAPIVEFGTYANGVFTKAADADAEAKATAMRLTYYTELDTLHGNVEKTAGVDGVADTLTYAFETKFAREAQNKFMGATIDIKSDFYALQNRKTQGKWCKVTAAESGDAVDNAMVDATGDWTSIGSFEKVINVEDGQTTAFNEDAGTDVSGSVNGAVKGSATK